MDGKFAEIGADLEPADGGTVIDAAGKFLMPGIIDTHSHIMITQGINEATRSLTPEVRIEDVIDTRDDSEYRALAGGVTAARLFHGSANVVGGQDAVVKLRFGQDAEAHKFDGRRQGVKFALGENVKDSKTAFPNTRLGVEATLKRAFTEAEDYARRQAAYKQAVKNDPAAKRTTLPPRRDLRLEALADLLAGRKFIHSHCYRADEILMLMRVADSFGMTVKSLQHVLEGYKIAPEIAAHGASASTFSDWWAYKVEAYDATPYNAAILNEAGVNTVIKSDDWELIRHLYFEAAKPVRYGNVDPADAVSFVTLNAARELGVEDRLGSIEVGKDADLAIYNAHPLNSFTRVEKTIVDGDVLFDRERAVTAMSEAMVERTKTPPTWTFPERRIRDLKLDLEPARGGTFALAGATLHTCDDALGDAGVIENGVIVVRDGAIETVGKVGEVELPDGVPVLNVTGLTITPGLFDSGTELGLTEIGKVSETQDYRESGDLQPDLRAGIALNRDSELLPVARAGGITHALVRPVGGLIAGQASVIQLSGWTAPEMVLELEAGLQINWPQARSFNPFSGGSSESDDRLTRRIEQLEEFLDEGKRYLAGQRAAEGAGELGPVPDPRFEALAPYLSGEKTVFFGANSARQIAQSLAFAEKFGLKPVITGGADAWKLADVLAEKDVPVIVGPVMRRPTEDHDPYDAPYANPGLLHEAGVRFALHSDEASNSRNTPFEAAQAVAYGLPEIAALRALTSDAAAILGVADRAGTLTPGKRASLVIADGSPLQITTGIKAVFVDGVPYAPESRQTRFYERYLNRIRTPEMQPATR